MLKNITPKDYDKWYRLGIPKVSDNGSWIGYKLDYKKAQDTLIIRQTQGQKRYVFPGGTRCSFIGKDRLSYKDTQNTLQLVDLDTGKSEKLPGFTQITQSENKRYLILYKKQERELIIRNLITGRSNTYDKVYDFKYSKASEMVSIAINRSKGNELNLLHLNNLDHIEHIFTNHPRRIEKIDWNEDGSQLVYMLEAKKGTKDSLDSGILGYYNVKEEKPRFLDLKTAEGFPKEYVLAMDSQLPFRISKNGKRVFFVYKRKTPLMSNDIPEVWKADDPYIYKKMDYQMNWENTNMIGMWDIESNRFIKVTDTKFPKAVINAAHNFALVYNPATYEPYPRANPPIDFYLKNLKTGQMRLLLKGHPNSSKSIFLSPSGNYLVYFKENQWWYYNLKKDRHINLNQKFKIIRKEPLSYNSANKSLPPGWGEGEKTIYMYDEFDLWKVPLGRGKPIRITNGRNKGIRYKLITKPEIEPESKGSLGIYKNNQHLLFYLDTEDKMNYGYAIKKPNEVPKEITFKESYMFRFWQNSSKDGSVFAYLEENNNVPPRVMLYSAKTESLDTVFQGNPHYNQYKHGTSKKVYYTNRYGKKLSGILRYPVDYNKDSLHPMVVYVYETQRQYFHQYKNPGMYNGVGFNAANLVNKGYFVFLPDIEYKIGEPGFSAADCIVSGTKAAINSAAINPNKVALVGHSFGGYETLFTITQTDLFTTAVAGAGIGNYPSEYLYIADKSRLNFAMFEDYQLRMGKPLFEDYQGYLDNSPVYHAKNVSTPLLIWSGKEDFHVNYYQSISFHLALKRMNKKNTLLLYPNETHALSNPKNQKDLSLRIQQWLAYYLMDSSKIDWMSK
ncbi:prolyl oligopeptidase family serine peptidase [Galbibacter sp. EGI 63066]|uniref:alpha/beta hydrolase family protein n=1 Tax=Galbibacter sp. EGI 63066 TaxID=2993559 RepID=UPI0022496C9C|nr:prolyl oligopeptidase family serine peptidase [Galbibacter sp. EGI 63066]MCX2680642.1 prolyl oligopeptidase family serine peptidase [Galbibacter sp. EGI 63066]